MPDPIAPEPSSRWPSYAAAAAAAGLLAWGLLSGPRGGLPEGAPAPAFHLSDLSGKDASLSEYRGKVLLLDFWATWCESCLDELPAIKAVHERFRGRPFAILAASVDEAGPEQVSEYAERHRMPYRVAMADAATARSYGVYGLPSKYLIDKDGLVYRRYVGEVEPSVLESDIRTLLERSPT